MQDKAAKGESGTLTPRSPTATQNGDLDYSVGYTERPFDSSEETRSGVDDCSQMLRKHKWRVGAIFAAFAVLGFLTTLMMTPLYTSTTRVQIDRNVAKVVESGNIAPLEGSDIEFLRTQYELLRGAAIAERVVSSLRLADETTFIDRGHFGVIEFIERLWGVEAHEPAPDRMALERAATTAVLVNRTIKPVSGSCLVDISFTDSDPDRAQKVAAALAQAFIDVNVDKRFQANAFAKRFLEDQIKQLQIRLRESEATLVEFGQKEQIVTATEKASIAEKNLAEGNATLGGLVAERIKNEQLYRQVDKVKAINFPQFLSNKVVEGLREKRNALVTEYREKAETFQPNYPGMIQISNKLKEIDRQIDIEVKTIKDALKGAYDASSGEEKEMKARVETLRAGVLDLQKRSIQYNILRREVDTNRSLYENLLQRYKEVDVASGAGANNVFVVERAQAPRTPSSPRLMRNLFISLSLGGIVAGGVVFVLERFDDTVGSAEELEQLTGLVTLGLTPKVDEKRIDQELVDRQSGLCEAYRSLCTSLHFATENGLPKSLLVTSAGHAEGKTVTALAIGRHFATLGMRVLMIDGDLRRPSLHLRLGVENTAGLSSYLIGGRSPPTVMQNTPIDNLVFMGAGPIPPNPADLLASSRFMTLLSVGSDVFDLIVIDSPPVLGLADAQLLANVASATVFVVRSRTTRKVALRASLKRLRFARANIIGAVLTGMDTKFGGYGHGYESDESYGRPALNYGRQPETEKEEWVA